MRILRVAHTQDRRGKGVEGDPVRMVDQYWIIPDEGAGPCSLLFERDPWGEDEKRNLAKVLGEMRDEGNE